MAKNRALEDKVAVLRRAGDASAAAAAAAADEAERLRLQLAVAESQIRQLETASGKRWFVTCCLPHTLWLTTRSLPPTAFQLAAGLGGEDAVTGDNSSAASEAASLSALLSASPTATVVATIGSSDDAMTGILSVQRQQLRTRIEQLEREAAAHRRHSSPETVRALSWHIVTFGCTGSRMPLKRNCRVFGRITWSYMRS